MKSSIPILFMSLIVLFMVITINNFEHHYTKKYSQKDLIKIKKDYQEYRKILKQPKSGDVLYSIIK